MVAALLVGGIGLLLAGLLAVGFGIPVKEFSFGNTLIITGAIVACTGMLMLGLWIAVRELKNIARRSGIPAEARAATATLGDQIPGGDGFLFSRDQPSPDSAGRGEAATQAPSSQPWQEEEVASRDRAEAETVEAAPAPKPRRNLLFSSTSRKERERAQARLAEPPPLELGPAGSGPAFPVASPPVGSGESPPATFEDAWPKSERARAADAPLPRRGGRAAPTFTEAGAGADRNPPAARSEEPPAVTVLKSGVVDGMAYSLYSDGSIEAQMPEGMMRFASIDELRSHLDQRS
jgi:hypothetical protein